jgi:hypothetical protein
MDISLSIEITRGSIVRVIIPGEMIWGIKALTWGNAVLTWS